MPVPFETVLTDELAAVRARREEQLGQKPQERSQAAEATCPESSPLERARDESHKQALVGLAFSGGGIRSGSVAMGFLQGLAKLRLLRIFDYLSTVSGGGYAGAWLAAWIHRECQVPSGTSDAAQHEVRGVVNVELQLDPSRIEQARANREGLNDNQVVDQEPGPVYHVRAHSNYLTPWGGLFSIDAWTLVAIYLRNTFINLTILFSAILFVVCVSRLLISGFKQDVPCDPVRAGLGCLAIGCFVVGFTFMHRQRERFRAINVQNPLACNCAPAELGFGYVFLCSIAPMVLACILLTWAFSANPEKPESLRYFGYEWVISIVKDSSGKDRFPLVLVYAVAFATFALMPMLFAILSHGLWQFHSWYCSSFIQRAAVALIAIVAFFGCLWSAVWISVTLVIVASVSVLAFVLLRLPAPNHPINDIVQSQSLRQYLRTLPSALISGCLFGLLCVLILTQVVRCLKGDSEALVTFCPPLFLLAFVVVGFVDQGLFCLYQSEHEREWRSRTTALVLVVAVTWVVFFAATTYLPAGFARLLSSEYGSAKSGSLIAGWMSTVLGGLIATRSARATPGSAASSWVLILLARVAPVLCLLGVLALLSAFLTIMAPPGEFLSLIFVVILCIIVMGIMSYVADVNLFSLHTLYGNRLVRCFIAASRQMSHQYPDECHNTPRRSAPTVVAGPMRPTGTFTGFDPCDDIPLADLDTSAPDSTTPNADQKRPKADGNEHGASKPKSAMYNGPYPIFNTALNLTAGDDLATRDRKAASFVLTPRYCGSDLTCYAPTPSGEAGRNLTIGRAMTVSGAAADANMPLESPAQVALLTLLNVRLGWWVQNPRCGQTWTAAPPTGGMLACVYRELFGLLHEREDFVHLTDGGHFDNSGVYELIRRRCRFVVALDAAEDQRDASENLANMMRKVRTDFGIRIEIDTTPLKKDANGLSRWHVAIGSIRYDDVDRDGMVGTFVFVRSSLTGDEPADLREYSARDPRFPHHNTISNQFFSEEQFESYRALGEHLAGSVFGEAAANLDVDQLRSRPGTNVRAVRRFFAELRNRWFPPPADFNQNYIAAGQTFAGLMQSLRTDRELVQLTHNLYPELAAIAAQVQNANGAGTAATVGNTLAPPPHPGVGTQNRDTLELLAVNQILDVMEMAWMGIDLENYYAHPLHRGWMGVFRRWASSDTFQKYWPILRGEYSKDFIRFCERTLNLPRVTALPRQLTAWEPTLCPVNAEFCHEWAAILSDATQAELLLGTGFHFHRDLNNTVCAEIRRAFETGTHALVWAIQLGRPPERVSLSSRTQIDERLSRFPVGLLVVSPISTRVIHSSITSPQDRRRCYEYYEVCFWLRGSYRSLGIGRAVVESLVPHPCGFGAPIPLHEAIRVTLQIRHPMRHPDRWIRLIARYPIVGNTAAERLQRSLWMNFFHDYEFRRLNSTRGERFFTLHHDIPPGPPAPPL
jgi:hypothetical protein